MNLSKHFDVGSLLVIAITFVLFVAAIFTTGFTHGLLLEAGVFLVSVKLILMAYKTSVSNNSIQQRLDEIHSAVLHVGRLNTPNSPLEPTGSPRNDRPPSGASGQSGR
jgi:hypothetical protein